MAMRVLIAGGGIGGLCLAQGLRKAGVEVVVFERDASAEARGQGFRLRLDANGDAALAACLPTELYELYRATSSKPAAPPSAAYDYQMRVIFRIGEGGASQGGTLQHMSVNRRTLREVLMGGLEDEVRFGKTVVRAEQGRDWVTAVLSDGSEVSGDVLVAADGIGSVLRRQMLPQAEPVDMGVRCVYGTTQLDDELVEALPGIFFSGFVPFAGPERQTLAMGPFRTRRPMEEAAWEIAPTVRLTAVKDYLMWLWVAPQEAYAMSDDDWRVADCASLQRKVLEMTEGWHPALRRVLQGAGTSTLFQVPVRTSLPLAPWTTTRVTLLGDAIHAMTPAGGIGANTALRDAKLLARLLGEAHRGDKDVMGAIGEYEAEMRAYGSAAARQSLEWAARLYRILMPEMEVA